MLRKLFNQLIVFFRLHPKRLLTLLYLPVYLLCFELIEWHIPGAPHRIHTPLDDYIPFVEIFVIPYILWFFYLFYAFFNLYKSEDPVPFYRLCGSCFLAMTIFIIVSVIYPNYHDLKNDVITRDNIFTSMLSVLYSIDPANNLLPSIHVCATIAAHWSLRSSEAFDRRPFARHVSFILSVLIVLATMFIKQHSTLDVALAFILMALEYPFFFGQLSTKTLRTLFRYDSQLLDCTEPESSGSVRRHP
ncbi:MAG: serine/threonine protein phosphatase [Lachnospiraceae bacterium]|nr:serine/threonine protein phosphatase [Lachnospiraceae bacterium]